MANLRSSKKDIRRTEKRTAVNKVYRDNMKSAVKGLRTEIAKKAVADESIYLSQKSIDKAAKEGIIKKQTAARLKSRLMSQANKVK
ncbi:MAG: 30S ribosomal protein S20 [bacterium]